jgi:hypothetical protein
MKAKGIGHNGVQLLLFPFQQVAAHRRGQPILQTYNLFVHATHQDARW